MGETNGDDAPGTPNILVRPVSGYSDLPKPARRLSDALAGLGDALRQPVGSFVATMKEGAPHKPSTVEIKFGLVFEGGADWKVVSFNAEANLDVTMTWGA